MPNFTAPAAAGHTLYIMTAVMKTVILQTDIVTDDAAANMAAATRLMDASPGADLYVLPEMWATGFCVSLTDATAAAAREARRWMAAEACRRHCAVAGSLAVPGAAGRWRNAFFFVHPDGHEDRYDKRHLFSPGDEPRQFAAGLERLVVTFRGVRFLLQVCYDLRFPVFARNRGDYDAILYVANWPDVRIDAWETLLRARAIENQCYVLGVNRIGLGTEGRYNGHSAIIDAYGRTLACAFDEEKALEAELDLERLAAFRSKFPVLADADAFELS